MLCLVTDSAPLPPVPRADPSNTNVYIGNIAPETAEADLHAYFTGEGPASRQGLERGSGCTGRQAGSSGRCVTPPGVACIRPRAPGPALNKLPPAPCSVWAGG